MTRVPQSASLAPTSPAVQPEQICKSQTEATGDDSVVTLNYPAGYQQGYNQVRARCGDRQPGG